MLSHHPTLLLSGAMAVVLLLAGCASETPPEPTATPDIPAMVRAAVHENLCTRATKPAQFRPGYCGRLCNETFWHTAGLEEVESELDRGADIKARNDEGDTPLHKAVRMNYDPTLVVQLL